MYSIIRIFAYLVSTVYVIKSPTLQYIPYLPRVSYLVLLYTNMYLYFSATLQKRLRRERRTRKELQEEYDAEVKRRLQLEEALKTAGNEEQIRLISGMYFYPY